MAIDLPLKIRSVLHAGRPLVTTIDAHTAGEPLRIFTGGLPELPGDTMLARRRYFHKHLDHIRRALMHEPRGHFDMYGCVMTPPVSPEADLGVLFMHNEGYSTMCGHGIIAVVTMLVETGAVAATTPRTKVNIDTPAGLVRAVADIDANGRIEKVAFQNVPSFVLHRDVEIEVDGLGRLTLDVAFGGAFYAILPATDIGRRVSLPDRRALVDAAGAIKGAVSRTLPIEHPTDADLSFLYGVIFTDAPEDASHHSRNLCVFAAAEVDRSPTGTGVSARLAVHVAKGEIGLHETIAVESILGQRSFFEVRAIERTQFGSYQAIVPEVSGRAFLTGRHEFFLDPADSLGTGFLV